MKLFEIDEQYRTWVDKITEAGGEITPEDEAEFDKIQKDYTQKAESYACVIKELSAEATALAEQEKNFHDRKASKQKTIDYLKNRLSIVMREKLNKDKLETTIAVISFRSSQAVKITDESIIPQEYTTTEIKVDKTAIKTAIKNGEVVAGAKLETNYNLQVK